MSPVISKFKISFDQDVVESIIPNPESMPYILKDELVNFYVVFKGNLNYPTQLSLSYEDSLNNLPFSSEIEIDPLAQNTEFIDKMGLFKRIRLLEESFHSEVKLKDMMYYVK